MDQSSRWTVEKSRQWYAGLPWLVGCNFTPSTAINQLEFWQEDTYDPGTIERELGWAQDIGLNTLRVYLHDLMYASDPDGFIKRVDHFLSIAARCGMRSLLTIFDDCWNQNPRLGRQPDPVPGVHNSGWCQSPGIGIVNDQSEWDRLEIYLKAVLKAFEGDERVLGWDLYNEPGNSGQGKKSFPLLKKVFEWAREVGPSQPLTCGVWEFTLDEMNAFQIEASDVVSFHHYGAVTELVKVIANLKEKANGRPIICTEYMARGLHSTFATHLPIFKRERIGAISWGLVSGKTQTNFPWKDYVSAHDPGLWFHEIFHPDGRPYLQEEVDFIRQITAETNKA